MALSLRHLEALWKSRSTQIPPERWKDFIPQPVPRRPTTLPTALWASMNQAGVPVPQHPGSAIGLVQVSHGYRVQMSGTIEGPKSTACSSEPASSCWFAFRQV